MKRTAPDGGATHNPQTARARGDVEFVPIASVAEADYNPRAISKDAAKALRASIERFGLVQPIVVNRRSGVVVGGHQRLRVMREAGFAEVPVVYVDLAVDEERALNVTLNNPGAQGVFTEAVDPIVMDLLNKFDDLNLDALLPKQGDVLVWDDTDEPPKEERVVATFDAPFSARAEIEQAIRAALPERSVVISVVHVEDEPARPRPRRTSRKGTRHGPSNS